MKAITTTTAPSKPTAQTQQSNFFAAKYLQECRFKMQNLDTFEVTTLYVRRTDKSRFRVKVFRSGQCVAAKYVEADSFESLLRNLSVTMFNL